MKFNMGCGQNPKPGFINVDASPASQPDEVWDLEQMPWPWPDDCATEVHFIHSLEHMGGDPKVFIALMQELYRIAAPDCKVVIHVPHPRHDSFINDPTHVRAVTPDMMALFDRSRNEEWRRIGASNTPLALYTGVDFRLEQTVNVLDQQYATEYEAGRLTADDANAAARSLNNVLAETHMTLRVRKPAG